MSAQENPYPYYLSAERVDELARMLLALTAEVWQLKDRNLVLEQLLKEQNVVTPEQIDQYQPSAEVAQQLLAERRALTRRVLGALHPSDQRMAEAMTSPR